MSDKELKELIQLIQELNMRVDELTKIVKNIVGPHKYGTSKRPVIGIPIRPLIINNPPRSRRWEIYCGQGR